MPAFFSWGSSGSPTSCSSASGPAGSPSYSVLTGDYHSQAVWRSTPIEVGRPIEPPTPVFAKLDAAVVDSELARLEASAQS